MLDPSLGYHYHWFGITLGSRFLHHFPAKIHAFVKTCCAGHKREIIAVQKNDLPSESKWKLAIQRKWQKWPTRSLSTVCFTLLRKFITALSKQLFGSKFVGKLYEFRVPRRTRLTLIIKTWFHVLCAHVSIHFELRKTLPINNTCQMILSEDGSSLYISSSGTNQFFSLREMLLSLYKFTPFS